MAGLPACSALPTPLTNLNRVDSGGTTADLPGDWNDAPAALDLALSESEMASIGVTGSEREGLWRVQVVTIENEEGQVTMTRVGTGSDANSAVRTTILIGVGGDRDREARLLDRLRDRLARLRGRGAAEIDSPMGTPE